QDARARGTAVSTLNHLTTYLTDQLFLLRAIKESGMNLKGLVNTQVHSAADCIFASATGKPLIHLDGVDSEEQMKRYFSWQESKHNAFSNVTTYLDQVPAATNEMAPPAYNQDAWKTFTTDVNGLFGRESLPECAGARCTNVESVACRLQDAGGLQPGRM